MIGQKRGCQGVERSKESCLDVLEKIAVWMIPGSMHEKYGEGYFRIALMPQSEDRLAEAKGRLKGLTDAKEGKKKE